MMTVDHSLCCMKRSSRGGFYVFGMVVRPASVPSFSGDDFRWQPRLCSTDVRRLDYRSPHERFRLFAAGIAHGALTGALCRRASGWVLGVALAGASVVVARADPQRFVTLADALAAVPKAPEREVARRRTVAARRLVDGRWTVAGHRGVVCHDLAYGALLTWRQLSVADLWDARGRTATARAELAVTAEEEAGVELGLRRIVREAWIDLYRVEALAVLAAQTAARESELAKISASRVEAGDAPRADAVAAEAESRRAAAEAKASSAAIAAASAVLAGELGWDLEQPLHTAGNLPEPDGTPALALC